MSFKPMWPRLSTSTFCAGRIGRELIDQVGPVVVFPKPLNQGLYEPGRSTAGRVLFSLHRKAPCFTLKERLRRRLLQVNLSKGEAGGGRTRVVC